MYARSTTVRGDPQALDEAIAYMRDDAMPTIQEMEGCIGLSMMCDRDSGRCIATTAWRSEEAMHDSERAVHNIRERYAEMMRGTPEVQECEIAVLHRLHTAPDGACCRVIWGQGDPADLDDATSTLRTSMMSRLEELPGFCSISMLVDRESGRAVTATVYESRDAMGRAAEQAKALREEFTRQLGLEVTEVAQFDLALAHLRVPETV